MEIKSPAKVNLFLNIGHKREDSFHELLSIMVKVSLWDEIFIDESDDIIVDGPEWLPMEENLVYKAALSLKNYTNTDKGCRIRIDKAIPPGRGLGGGSSNCGTVLKGLNKFWGLNLDQHTLESIGGELGSDVNFFLHPKDCIVRGRGEIVEPIDRSFEEDKYILIIDTGIHIPTKDVYKEYRNGKLTAEGELNKIIDNYRSGNWEEILRNDLESVVYRNYPVGNISPFVRKRVVHVCYS
jgi:4-diphosphocytidyl-2-C-methyl-D-erythritol kinase